MAESFQSLQDLADKIASNIEWHEKSLLILAFHQYAQKISGPGISGNPGRLGKKGWALRDSAKALQMHLATLCEELKLAREIELDPTLKRFKSKNLALAFLKGQSGST